MMLLHPLDRIASQTLREDRLAISLADEIGHTTACAERHQQYAEFVDWGHLQGLASAPLMTDFSSNHFQKARAKPIFLQIETLQWLRFAGNSRLLVLCRLHDGYRRWATNGLWSLGRRDALN